MTFFNEYVDFFEQVQHTSWYGRLLQGFSGFLEVTPEMAVLDVGCGPGYLTRLLAEKVRAVSCVDISPAMVKKAREHAEEENLENVYYAVGTAESIPEENEYFDMAVATSVIYFLPDPVLALEEMARVIKRGGRIAMLNPSDRMTDNNVTSFINEHRLTGFEADALESWLDAAKGARRLSEDYASKIMTAAGLSEIRHERHLNGMVLFSGAVKAIHVI